MGEAIDQQDDIDRSERLAAAYELFEIEAPVDDWPVMKAQIIAAHRIDEREPPSS
jgi:hypothetical protein